MKLEDAFKAVFADESKVSVGEVAKTLSVILLAGENRLDSIKNVKNKVTKGEWNAFVNSISTSFLASIYVNAAESDEEKRKRLDMMSEATKGLLKAGGEA